MLNDELEISAADGEGFDTVEVRRLVPDLLTGFSSFVSLLACAVGKPPVLDLDRVLGGDDTADCEEDNRPLLGLLSDDLVCCFPAGFGGDFNFGFFVPALKSGSGSISFLFPALPLGFSWPGLDTTSKPLFL